MTTGLVFFRELLSARGPGLPDEESVLISDLGENSRSPPALGTCQNDIAGSLLGRY